MMQLRETKATPSAPVEGAAQGTPPSSPVTDSPALSWQALTKATFFRRAI